MLIPAPTSKKVTHNNMTSPPGQQYSGALRHNYMTTIVTVSAADHPTPQGLCEA